MALMDTLRGLFGRAKQEAAELSEKAAPMVEKAKGAAAEAREKAGPAMEKAKEVAAEAREKAAPMVEKAKEAAVEAGGKAREAVESRRAPSSGTEPVDAPEPVEEAAASANDAIDDDPA